MYLQYRDLLKALGYQGIIEEGIPGVRMTLLAQALLADNRLGFVEREQYIFSPSLTAAEKAVCIQAAMTKLKAKQDLDPEEKFLVELHAYFESMAIFLSLNAEVELFRQIVPFNAFEQRFDVIAPNKLKEKSSHPILQPFKQTFHLPIDQTEVFFERLKQICEQIKLPIVFYIVRDNSPDVLFFNPDPRDNGYTNFSLGQNKKAFRPNANNTRFCSFNLHVLIAGKYQAFVGELAVKMQKIAADFQPPIESFSEELLELAIAASSHLLVKRFLAEKPDRAVTAITAEQPMNNLGRAAMLSDLDTFLLLKTAAKNRDLAPVNSEGSYAIFLALLLGNMPVYNYLFETYTQKNVFFEHLDLCIQLMAATIQLKLFTESQRLFQVLLQPVNHLLQDIQSSADPQISELGSTLTAIKEELEKDFAPYTKGDKRVSSHLILLAKVTALFGQLIIHLKQEVDLEKRSGLVQNFQKRTEIQSWLKTKEQQSWTVYLSGLAFAGTLGAMMGMFLSPTTALGVTAGSAVLSFPRLAAQFLKFFGKNTSSLAAVRNLGQGIIPAPKN